jgi:cytochrome c1
MPPFQGRVNEEEVMQLIAYIKSLGQPGAKQAATAKPAESPGGVGGSR